MQHPSGSAHAADGRPHGSGRGTTLDSPRVNGGAIHVEQPDDPVEYPLPVFGARERRERFERDRATRLHEELDELARPHAIHPRSITGSVSFPRRLLTAGGPSRLSGLEKALLVFLALFLAWVAYQALDLLVADYQARQYLQEASR